MERLGTPTNMSNNTRRLCCCCCIYSLLFSRHQTKSNPRTTQLSLSHNKIFIQSSKISRQPEQRPGAPARDRPAPGHVHAHRFCRVFHPEPRHVAVIMAATVATEGAATTANVDDTRMAVTGGSV